MGFSSFGLNKIDEPGQFDALLRELDAVRPTAAQIISLTCYQTEYEIFNHDRPNNRPLALVAHHDKEDVLEGGPLYTHIRQFFNYRLHKLFGISLTEFLEYPPHVVEFLYSIARADVDHQDHTHRDVQKQLNLDLDD